MEKNYWDENEGVEFNVADSNQEAEVVGAYSVQESPQEILLDLEAEPVEGYQGQGQEHKQEFQETYQEPQPVTTVQNEIQFEVLPNKSAQSKSHFKRTAAVVLLAVVLGAGSLGFGLALGVRTSDKFISYVNAPKFKFEEPVKDSESAPKIQYISSAIDISEMIKEVQDSVVNISISAERSFFSRTFETEEAGSGVIYAEDDDRVYIVTNNHVVKDASSAYVSIKNDERISANLAGKNPKADLAVISVLKSDLKDAGIDSVVLARFGDSDLAQVGEQVVAIGNALGQGKTVTSGIVSVKNKQITVDNVTLDVVQTDAAINPGNSGGALVNSRGEVIGINTAKLASTTIEGTGFAITSNVVKDIADEIIARSKDGGRPYLGVTGFTITEEFKNMYNINKNGFYVDIVSKNSTASNAGIKSSDIIIGINGVPTEDYEALTNEILKNKIGDKISITIIRNGVQEMTLQAELIPLAEEF